MKRGHIMDLDRQKAGRDGPADLLEKDEGGW
jgi:hypothetical protein